MILKTRVYGCDFVGLFLLSAGDTIYYSKFLHETNFAKELQTTKARKCESHMLGMFFAGNKNGIVGGLPLKNSTLIETNFNALGNLILTNDKGAIVSPLIKDKKSEIEKVLGVKTKVSTIAGMDLIGSLAIANNKGVAVHQETTETEMDLIEKTLKVDVDFGTLYRSGFLGSMATATNDTLIIGPSILAPEIALLMEILEIE